MLTITNNRIDIKSTEQAVHRLGEINFTVDVQEAKDDLEKLKEKLKNPKYKLHTKEINKTASYIKRMISKVDNGEISIVWSISDNILRSYPINFTSVPELGIDMINYIKLQDDEKMCLVSYRQALEIITFDMMYRDLGYTFEDLEKNLEDVGITGVHSASIISKLIEDDDIIRDAKMYRIGDTPYRGLDAGRYRQYFRLDDETNHVKTNLYKDITIPSYQVAMTLITGKVLEELQNNYVRFKLVGVGIDGIYIIVPTQAEAERIPKEPVAVKALGRLFEVMPKLTIF